MKIYILFSVVIFNFLFISCSNLTSPVKSDFSLGDFPTEQGTYWTYKVTDLVNNTSDNLIVSIHGNVSLPNNKLATIWEYKYSDHIDTMYVVISGDTISFYEKQFYEQFRFVFPLTIGNKWDTNIGDANVTSNETLQINSLNKYYSYKVTIYPTHWGNAGGNQLYFISPGVGIVRFDNSIFETDISQRYHTVWELRYFHRG